VSPVRPVVSSKSGEKDGPLPSASFEPARKWYRVPGSRLLTITECCIVRSSERNDRV